MIAKSLLATMALLVSVNALAADKGWWCLPSEKFDDGKYEGTHYGVCYRTERECDQVRRRWNRVHNCSHQKKAAVFTYFNKLQNDFTEVTADTTVTCEELRRRFLNSDIRLDIDVKPCKLVK